MLSQNKMTGVKFKDKQDLKQKKANAQLKDDEKYWTALRYEQVHPKRKTQANKLLGINYLRVLVDGTDGQNHDNVCPNCSAPLVPKIV